MPCRMAEEVSVSAHSSSSATKPASGCVVLRVKRKREEDPADALVVAKHNKLDAGSSVFHFVGTLKEDASDGVILDRLKHYRDRSDCVKSNPLARLTLEDTKIQTRDRTKANSSAQRFKVTSQLRCLQEECSSDSSGKKGSSAADEERGAVAAASEPAGVNVHICDVNQEDFTLEDLSSEATGPVTCNGSVMVREKVEHKKAGYVYDLYCAQEPEMLNLEAATFDWNSLSVYEPELVHDIIDDLEERYDDEDDSNDENNWRNEYPDEEGPTPSSNSDLDNYGDYRHTRALYSSDEDYRFDDFL